MLQGPARVRKITLLLAIGAIAIGVTVFSSERGSSSPWSPLRTEKARVVHVNDGDTITVRLLDDPHQEKERVRLIGLDVPETDDSRPAYKRLGLEARAFAVAALEGRVVTLERDAVTENRDKFGRLLRYVVTADGRNFNETMIGRGYGRMYRRFKFSLKDRFEAAERAAKTAGTGYWQLPPGPSRTQSRDKN